MAKIMTAFKYLARLWWLLKAPFTKDGEAKHSLRFLCLVAPALLRAKGPRILFDRHAGLGDVICSFPAVLALKEKYPDSVIVFTVSAAFAPAVKLARVADIVAPLHYGVWTNPGWMNQFFDLVYRPMLGDELKGVTKVHLVDRFCEQVGVESPSRQPRLHVSPDLGKRMRTRFRQHHLDREIVVAINTGPSWGVKDWTTEGWTQLGRWLTEERKVRVIQLGADLHLALGAIKAVRVPGALDWIGKISLEETIACIQTCDLFIGIDSGLLHVAGAVGTPSVSIFGPTEASLILPLETPAMAVTGDVDCLGCHHRHPILHWRSGCPHDIACMKTLPAGRVIDACEEMLKAAEVAGKRSN